MVTGKVYQVKDSGEREQFDTGAQRDTRTGKGRFDLIPVTPLQRLAAVMEKGAAKYDDHNWAKGIKFSRCADSALRHIMQWQQGLEDEDHLGHAVFNLFAIMHFEDAGRTDLDDRHWETKKIDAVLSDYLSSYRDVLTDYYAKRALEAEMSAYADDPPPPPSTPEEIIYVSGPMTGQPGHGFDRFNAAAVVLREQGYAVVNPAEYGADLGESPSDWHKYMKRDIPLLLNCDSIYMLNNWRESKGASMEKYIAETLGKKVVYQGRCIPGLMDLLPDAGLW